MKVTIQSKLPRQKTAIFFHEKHAGRNVIYHWLQSKFKHIEMMHSCEEALTFMREKQESVAMMIVDSDCRQCDLLGFIAEAKKTHPEMKILLTSHYAHDSRRLDAYESGVDAFLIKPFHKKEADNLLEHMAEMVGSHTGKPLTVQFSQDVVPDFKMDSPDY